MNQPIAERIRQCPGLPSLPAIAIQVLDLAQREDLDIAEIAKVISRDPALSGRILRTVNSSFYGRANAVGTISQALVLLGIQAVKALVLGFSLVSNLAQTKAKGFKHLQYWRRSIYAATAARVLAPKAGIVQQEEAFLAALLQDIGMLALDQVLGEAYGEVCGKVGSHEDLAAAEMEAAGVTHADAGGILAQQWHLPQLLAAPIAGHHDPAKVEDPALRKLAELAQISGRCADVFVDESPGAAIARARDTLEKAYAIPGADADLLLDEIGKRTREVASLFEINLGSHQEYEAILKKANEALVEISLKSQQQATQNRQRVQTLARQNQQLQTAAQTDGLTGLANRTRFDAFVAAQFKAAVEQGTPLALLMLDVDKFKAVNDQFGHPAGDIVLRYVARVVGAAARHGELAARYGGEELCLVMPGADRTAAATTAERVRKALESKPVPRTDGKAIPITASVGVAVWEPGCPLTDPAHLVKAADVAVYAAKAAGRNTVKVIALNAGKHAA